MKNLSYCLVLITAFSVFTSCATIIGGSKYYAHVKVEDHPNAKISCNNDYQGTGNVVVKTKRANANQFSITVEEKGCDKQTFDFTERTFRGWAFAGTVVGWTGLYAGIPLPWGIVTDLSTGALWKPDINEEGITKIDSKHYNYNIDYTGCEQKVEIDK